MGSAELDTRQLLFSLWMKRFLVIIPTFAAFFVTYTAVNMIAPRYSSEARVYVENRESVYAQSMIGGATRAVPSESLALDQEAIASHVQLMYSRDLAKTVIRDLKLGNLPEFNSGGGQSFLTTPLLLLGLIKDTSRMSAEERTMDNYYERLTIYPVEKSRVIEIKFQSQDPLIASKVSNAIANKYLELELQAKLERDRKASQHVQNKIDDLRKQVEEAETKVATFRSKNQLFLGDNNQSLTSQQLTELTTQLSLAQTQYAESQQKAKVIRDLLKSGRSIEASDVLNSPLMQRLIEQRTTLRGEIALAATTLLPAHPKMREIQAQHADLERQIRDEAAKIARGLESDAKVAEVRLDTIKENFDEAKKTTTTSGGQEVTLRALEREAKAQRDLLESWLGMYREAIARDGLEARNVDGRVVSLAAPSNSPAFPKKGPIVLIATLGTLLLMVIIVFTNEMASGRAFIVTEMVAPVAVPQETVTARDPASFGSGKNKTRDMPVDLGFTLEPRNEKAVMTDLLFTLLDPGNEGAEAQILYVAGATSSVQEGQFALRLGRALVQAKRRAVVVDVNMMRPQLSLIANSYSGKGLSELLAGKAPVGSVIYRDTSSRLNIIPFGSAQRDLPARSFTRPSFEKCMKALTATYDFVILAGPAVGETDEAGDLASLADNVILLGYETMPEDIIAKARDAFLAAGAADVEVAVFIDDGDMAHRGRAQVSA
ncbi:MAG: exopolysaccharide transport family protein [Pseudomonadota bacterium]